MQFSTQPPVRHQTPGGRVVMVASLNRNKGQDLLLAAFARLADPTAQLWFYGTTGLSAHGFVRRLQRFAAEHGLAGRVFFPGPTADVQAVFAEAAVVVHTSWTESFGMALVEAMACGVPVIAHDLEGMAEVVIHGETGFLIPPGDTEALVSRLDQLLGDPELREQLGARAWRSVRERFSSSDRVAEYLALYQGICPP
jgi:glycosyltransferase involved in cell wall biosynthesis